MERDLVGNLALVREVKLWKYHVQQYQHQQHLFLCVLLLLNSNVKQELRHPIQTFNTFYYSE